MLEETRYQLLSQLSNLTTVSMVIKWLMFKRITSHLRWLLIYWHLLCPRTIARTLSGDARLTSDVCRVHRA